MSPELFLLYQGRDLLMVSHMEKLTNIVSLMKVQMSWVSWPNILSIEWKIFWTSDSRACFKFGPVWNSNLFTFWLCLRCLSFSPLVLARFSYQNKSVPTFSKRGEMVSDWQILSFVTAHGWMGTKASWFRKSVTKENMYIQQLQLSTWVIMREKAPNFRTII